MSKATDEYVTEEEFCDHKIPFIIFCSILIFIKVVFDVSMLQSGIILTLVSCSSFLYIFLKRSDFNDDNKDLFVFFGGVGYLGYLYGLTVLITRFVNYLFHFDQPAFVGLCVFVFLLLAPIYSFMIYCEYICKDDQESTGGN